MERALDGGHTDLMDNHFDELAKAMSRGRALKLFGIGAIGLFLAPGPVEARRRHKKRHHKKRVPQQTCLPSGAPCTPGVSVCCDYNFACFRVDPCGSHTCNIFTGTPFPIPPGGCP